jgi:rubrerythrin
MLNNGHEDNSTKPMFSVGQFHPNKYWECECCGLLISMPQQDDVSKYDCPACKLSKCEHGGKFVEISLQKFCTNANIVCI